jgi:hypothetical protein
MSEVKVNKISPRSGTDVTLGDSGDTFTIPAGATLTNNGTASGFASIAWQSAIKTASFTAVAGEGYWINTTSSAITITLPASASVGDQIIFTDYARTWATNTVTVNQNSLNFQGNTSPNPIYNTNGQSVNIVYSGATQGWIPNSDDDVAFETEQFYSADILVIAGGGSGGSISNGGGGGAGGYRTSTETLNSGTTYTITVGDGGAQSSDAVGNNGSDSSISGSGLTTITSTGGGGGGGGATPGITEGRNGGSGGGAGAPGYGAGGGGGAGAVGQTGTTSKGGDGGAGAASSITGSSVTRAGGGGGSTDSTIGTGGAGGGGDGGYESSGTAGTANTGSGGGGGESSPHAGGAGGKGVVILSVPTASYSGTTSGSPTVTTSGVNTIMQFNGSGSYTA